MDRLVTLVAIPPAFFLVSSLLGFIFILVTVSETCWESWTNQTFLMQYSLFGLFAAMMTFLFCGRLSAWTTITTTTTATKRLRFTTSSFRRSLTLSSSPLPQRHRLLGNNRGRFVSTAVQSHSAIDALDEAPEDRRRSERNSRSRSASLEQERSLQQPNLLLLLDQPQQPEQPEQPPPPPPELLLDPLELCNGTLPMIKSLSPSSITEFMNCPQSFLFQYILGIKQPKTLALAKGSMCHTALEQLFDLPPADRTLPHLHNLFRKAWSEARHAPDYAHLFAPNQEEDSSSTSSTSTSSSNTNDEAEWGRSGLQLLDNYMQAENPTVIQPARRELWVQSHLSVDPTRGATGYTARTTTTATTTATTTNDNNSNETFLVRGIIDRLDLVKVKDGHGSSKGPIRPAAHSSRHTPSVVELRIVDYKTGAAPQLKYSPPVNERIRREVFFQLQIYALLLRERGADVPYDTLPVRFLRLLYLTNAAGRAQALELDLGASVEERDARLQQVHAQVAQVWTRMDQLVRQQDPTAFVGCQRSFCYCQVGRDKFRPGTVWEPTRP